MALKDRIEKLKPYLLVYNVSMEDGVQYAVLRIPKNWSVPVQEIKNAYGVEVRNIEGGICFLAEIDKGSDVLFDSLEYAVDLNVRLLERAELLKEKVEELKNIFLTEKSIEKLKTIEFVFKPRKKGVAKAKAAVEKPQEEANEVVVKEEPKDSGDTGLMDFVEKSIEE